MLNFGLCWFSISTMLLPIFVHFTHQLPSLLLLSVFASRVLVGVGEGLVMPSMTNLVSTYVKPALRGTALGSIMSAFHSGNLVGLIVAPLVIGKFGWRAVFYCFGLAGIPVILLWNYVVPEPTTQAQNHTASKTETISITRLLSSLPCWAIFASHFVNNWGYFILLGWMPTYFSRELGFNLRDSSLLSFLPWCVISIGATAMGLLADKLL